MPQFGGSILRVVDFAIKTSPDEHDAGMCPDL